MKAKKWTSCKLFETKAPVSAVLLIPTKAARAPTLKKPRLASGCPKPLMSTRPPHGKTTHKTPNMAQQLQPHAPPRVVAAGEMGHLGETKPCVPVSVVSPVIFVVGELSTRTPGSPLGSFWKPTDSRQGRMYHQHCLGQRSETKFSK